MDGTRVLWPELDENYDGAIDRWEDYGDRPASAPTRCPPLECPRCPAASCQRAEQSTRFDGKVNRWERYENGQLARVEEDTTGDGRAGQVGDLVRTGRCRRWRSTPRARGKPDRRLVYPADGGAPQLLGRTGDGTFRPVAQPGEVSRV